MCDKDERPLAGRCQRKVEEVCSRRRAGGEEIAEVVVVVVGEEEGVEFGGDKLGKQNSQPLTGQKPVFVDPTYSADYISGFPHSY